MIEPEAAARLALGLMDLTRLEADDEASAIISLCRRAATPFGPPAAICIHAEWLATARKTLRELGLEGSVRLATVANFPAGDADPGQAAAEVREALALGADEVDVVFPWRRFMAGDDQAGRTLVSACREACTERVLKVILETGCLQSPRHIERAGRIAIEAGADFLKTSTGKVAINATPEAARILLETIRDSGADVGCKVSGGIRDTAQAQAYLELAAEIMGADWITARHFRFGASGLLDDLLATLSDGPNAGRGRDAY
ncbi:MAG: deoxyribose-phosphate aldolase [Xanthomonadales bacterium]|nr:deoxyribose-phosphate aldolase [Xanthomonadales bacterium]